MESLGFKLYETPFETDIPMKLEFDLKDNRIGGRATCYGDDSFVDNQTHNYEIVDMEAYAIAKACYLFGIEFISYMFVTDEADEDSINDWEENASKGIDAFISVHWE